MLDVNLNLYNEFYKVANSKSLGEASAKHNKSSVSFSKNIKELEDVFGFALFYRTPKGMKLTEAGQELYNYVEKALMTLDTGEKVALANNNIMNSKITIGCPSHISEFYLINFINELRKEYPSVKLKIVAGLSGSELLKMLENHKIDFIIDSTKLEIDTSKFKVIKIKEIANIFVSNEEIKINKAKELENYQYILPFESTSTKQKLEECLLEQNIHIVANTEVDITELRVELTKNGLGIAYVLEDAVKREIESKILYKVETPFKLPTTNLNLIYCQGTLTKADTLFIKKYLKEKV